MKEYERLKKVEQNKELEKTSAETATKVTQFLKVENDIVSKPLQPFVSKELAGSSVSNMVNGHEKDLPSFWIPSKTPTAKLLKLDKPVSNNIVVLLV